MKANFISQNTGNMDFARVVRGPVCSKVWTITTAFTNVNFAYMVKPAHEQLGYGAGKTHPRLRPFVPM